MVRIASAEIADRRRLFELFTALKTNSNNKNQQVIERGRARERERERERAREKAIERNKENARESETSMFIPKREWNIHRMSEVCVCVCVCDREGVRGRVTRGKGRREGGREGGKESKRDEH